MVVVDVDVIVTGRLDALVAAAVEKPLLFPNDQTARFHTGWAKLGYGPAGQHLYVASGQFVLPLGSSLGFLQTWSEGLGRFAAEPALGARALSPEDDAFYYPDMDVLNAMIGTALPLDSYALADASTVAYWPFRGLRRPRPRTARGGGFDGNPANSTPPHPRQAMEHTGGAKRVLQPDDPPSMRLRSLNSPSGGEDPVRIAARVPRGPPHAATPSLAYGFRSASVVNWASAAGWRAGTPPRFGRDIRSVRFSKNGAFARWLHSASPVTVTSSGPISATSWVGLSNRSTARAFASRGGHRTRPQSDATRSAALLRADHRGSARTGQTTHDAQDPLQPGLPSDERCRASVLGPRSSDSGVQLRRVTRTRRGTEFDDGGGSAPDCRGGSSRRRHRSRRRQSWTRHAYGDRRANEPRRRNSTSGPFA